MVLLIPLWLGGEARSSWRKECLVVVHYLETPDAAAEMEFGLEGAFEYGGGGEGEEADMFVVGAC